MSQRDALLAVMSRRTSLRPRGVKLLPVLLVAPSAISMLSGIQSVSWLLALLLGITGIVWIGAEVVAVH